MKIKLKESIISELTCLGLKPGMVISSNEVNKTTGAVHFTRYHNCSSHDCVVWPEDYEVVEQDEVLQMPEQVNALSEFTLQAGDVTDALDAMYWCFSPYLGNPDISESPWIVNLIKSYNSIVSSLPNPWNFQYEAIEF